jgi:hypothetical protein
MSKSCLASVAFDFVNYFLLLKNAIVMHSLCFPFISLTSPLLHLLALPLLNVGTSQTYVLDLHLYFLPR